MTVLLIIALVLLGFSTLALIFDNQDKASSRYYRYEGWDGFIFVMGILTRLFWAVVLGNCF